MNIFFLDEDTLSAAEALHDVHLNKMILETSQLLSNTHHINLSGFLQLSNYVTYRSGPFKPTHLHHPCTIWLNQSIENYRWTSQYLVFLCREFTLRRNKQHKVEQFANYFRYNEPRLPIAPMTIPALCMPDIYKVGIASMANVVYSYRNYYICEKWKDKNGKRLDKWTRRGQPNWWLTPESRGIA